MSTSAVARVSEGNSDGIRSGPEIEIALDEVAEGDQVASRNYRFSRVGEAVRINSDPGFKYDAETPPSQPLAVSQRFHLVFVAHSNGFYVAKTKEVMASAQRIKDEGNGPALQELSLVDVPIGKVSILALSTNDYWLAAAVANQLHFFSLSALLHQEQKPSFSVSLDDSVCIMDMRWARQAERAYVVLSSSGKLYHGSGQGSLVEKMDNVDAVEWSANGNFVAVARKNILSIMASDFIEKFSFSLSPNTLRVDAIRWVRADSLVVGCFDIGSDSEEPNYLLQVITSQDKQITDASCKPVVLSFSDMFLDFQTNMVPHASGPNLFLSYLDHYELAFVANRKNLSQHVVLLGWSVNNRKNEASFIELSNDAWCPHIESQGNGDDNLVLALSVDKVSKTDESKFILGEEETEVSPCCILLCLTIEGKLALFYFASAAGASVSSEVHDDSDGKEDALPEIMLENRLSGISSSEGGPEKLDQNVLVQESNDTNLGKTYSGWGEENRTEIIQQSGTRQNNKFQGESSFGIQKQKPLVNFEALRGHDEQKFLPVTVNQDRVPQQSVSVEKPGLKLGQSSSGMSSLEEPGNVGEMKTEGFTVSKPHSDSFSGKALTSWSSQPVSENLQGCGTIQFPGKIAATDQKNASSFSFSYEKATPLKSSDEKLSLSTTGTIHRRSSGNALQLSGGLIQYPSQLQPAAVPTVPINSSGQKAKMGVRNNASSPVFTSTQVQLQENFISAKSSKSRFSEENSTTAGTGLPIPEQNLSKQLRNVEEMAKKMDHLMEGIEGIGGFVDASIASQESSVVKLEEGLWTLSERCTMWRGALDGRLRDIQLLLDKTVQVLARKMYMKEIFKQATDSQYWDLWNCQKLSSELELKRQHILEVNQDLTTQLLELERHFNTIEIDKFGESGSRTNRRMMQSRQGKSRDAHSLRSLQNTMGAQLTAAEKLSECLLEQMAALNIESPERKQNVKRELFETIGLTYDNSPGKEQSSSIPPRNQLLITSSSLAAKELSKRNKNTPVKSSEPETVRRRRESLDQNWSTFKPPKTTVKRILLQEDREKTSTIKSPLQVDKHGLKQHIPTESAVLRSPPSDKSATSIYQSKTKVIPGTREKRSTERPSTSLFQWADTSPTSLNGRSQSGPQPNITRGSQRNENVSVQTISNSNLNSGENLMKVVAVSQPEPPSGTSDMKVGRTMATTPTEQSGNLKSKNQLKVDGIFSPFSGLASNSMPELPNTSINNLLAVSQPLPPFGTSDMKQEHTTAPTPMEQPADLKSQNQLKVGGMFSPVSGLASNSKPEHPYTSGSNSLAVSRPEPPSVMSDIKLGQTMASTLTELAGNMKSQNQLKAGGKFSLMSGFASNSNPEQPYTSGIDSLAVSQPEPPSGMSDTKLGHAMASTSIELPGNLKSQNQLKVGGILSPVSDMASNSEPEQPNTSGSSSQAVIQNFEMPNDGKSGSSDAVTQEDEMEEEAPEAAELALGDLGGFGFGSVPNSTNLNPNPFGLAMLNRAAAPVSSPFTAAAPSGELFRPASLNFQSPLPTQTSQSANISAFSSGFGTGSPIQVTAAGGFGQPAQIGVGQQALGSVLGAFGQSRQLGAGLPGNGVASAAGFSSGFSGMSTGGFGGGFAGVAPAAGGFASLTAGGGVGGFAAAATAGGGFAAAATTAGAGFAAAASVGGGFAAAANTGAGFAGASAAGFSGSGFGTFSNQQGAGGFSAFSSSSGSGRPPSDLFTQMRK